MIFIHKNKEMIIHIILLNVLYTGEQIFVEHIRFIFYPNYLCFYFEVIMNVY